jgi:hypothetical protein
MNVDSLFSYAIFLALIVSVIYFVSSIYPNFEYIYFIEETKYQKGIAKYDLGENFEITTKVKCIYLPNYFKTDDFEVNGNYIISNVSYTIDGVAVGDETYFGSVPSNTKVYVYGDKACFNEVVSVETHGNKTSYSVTFTEKYIENGIELEKIYRKWLV